MFQTVRRVLTESLLLQAGHDRRTRKSRVARRQRASPRRGPRIGRAYLDQLPCGRAQRALFGGGAPNDYCLHPSTTTFNRYRRRWTIPERWAHLLRALDGVRRLLNDGEQPTERLSTFSRIAFDAASEPWAYSYSLPIDREAWRKHPTSP